MVRWPSSETPSEPSYKGNWKSLVPLTPQHEPQPKQKQQQQQQQFRPIWVEPGGWSRRAGTDMALN